MTSSSPSQFFREEFTLRKLGFITEDVTSLGTCESDRWPRINLVYRSLWALWWVATFCYDFGVVKDKGAFWLLLTNWTYICITISSVVQLIATIYVYRNKALLEAERSRISPLLLRVNWALYSMSSGLPLIVTILYSSGYLNGGEVHYVTTAYVLIDIFVTGIPVRILHFWLSELLFNCYIVLTLIYWAITKKVEYGVLNYNSEKPVAPIVLILTVIFLAIPICQLLLFLLFWVRKIIYERFMCALPNFCPKRRHDESHDLQRL